MLRFLVLSLAGLVAVGCAQPPRPAPAAPASVPVIREASLQPGCLLPSPDVIDAAAAGSVELLVDVSPTGLPVNATVVRSTGRADRDRAFQQAAMACPFNPASSYTPASGERKSIAGQYTLAYAWPARHEFVGTSRCFPPAYPEAARRFDEAAEVQVYFRRPAPDAPFEFRVTSSRPAPRLTQASLVATERCLAHPEVQAGVRAGPWYLAPFSWRLE